MKRYLILIALVLLASTACAQTVQAAKETRRGNREYRAKRFDQAEVGYRRALQSDSTAYRAHHNLGNSLYRQKKYDEAASHFAKAAQSPAVSDRQRSRIFHNLGNSMLKSGLQKENRAEGMEQFKQAVDAYQQSLMLNPKNGETRYNLSYAQKMLQQAQQQQQQQQQKGGGKDQQQKDGKNGNQGKDGNLGKDQQQKQDQNQNGGQNKPDQPNQDRQQQKQQQKRDQQKKQDAERLLEAVKNNEKNTMKENAKKLEVASPGRIEKDW